MACKNYLLILMRRALYVAQRGLQFGIIHKRKSGWWIEQNRTGDVNINVTLRRVRATIVGEKKAINITNSECVLVALVIQHAKRMRHIPWSNVVSLALLHFSTLTHKRHKTLVNTQCVFVFSTNFV